EALISIAPPAGRWDFDGIVPPARWLVIQGEQDEIVDPQAHSVRLHQAIPQSSLVIVQGAGHMVHYAADGQIVDAVDAMAERHGCRGQCLAVRIDAQCS
ncbi:alpha/beta fold hydrolase, partial [Mesorhizobium sp. M4B.F.Ca.ET.211.01.1.1]|uniref:alpha/beta fold hydrolase n=1 Tax=Mesorhizobium sp. M4B.F.Ca.ET.211.01.1.1 TaxID=2563954 RepID=UPI001092C991